MATPARFIFATAEGGVSGWNGGATAIKKVDAFPDAALSWNCISE